MDRMKERVHLIVARWMRGVLASKGWSARHWAELAGIEPSSITRIMNPPPGEEPILPTTLNIAKLAAVAKSQPDLLHGNRRLASYVPAATAATAVSKRKAG